MSGARRWLAGAVLVGVAVVMSAGLVIAGYGGLAGAAVLRSLAQLVGAI